MIRFSIPGKKGAKLLDSSKAVMALNIRMTNKDKTNSTPVGTGAAPVQNFSSSIFRSVNIKFNDTSVCQISNYGVYSQLSLMLNTNNNDMATWMANLCYEKDTSADWDATETNQGWIQRRNHFGMTVPDDGSANAGKFVWQKGAEFFMAELRSFLPVFHFLPNVDVSSIGSGAILSMFFLYLKILGGH